MKLNMSESTKEFFNELFNNTIKREDFGIPNKNFKQWIVFKNNYEFRVVYSEKYNRKEIYQKDLLVIDIDENSVSSFLLDKDEIKELVKKIKN